MEELIDKLETMNYNNPDTQSTVAWQLGISSDPILLGKDENGDMYCIILSPDYALLADHRSLQSAMN